MQAEFAASGVGGIVAGVIGPRRDAWTHDAAMSVDEAEAYHALQMEGFAAGGVDEVHVYTLTNTPEAIGIARLAQKAGLPIVLSFTVETDGRLPGGKSLGEAITEVDEATGGSAAYFMVNCAHPRHFRSTLEGGEAWVGRIGGLRPMPRQRVTPSWTRPPKSTPATSMIWGANTGPCYRPCPTFS
jgi:S-methylmethionine-dependent homocysteine/selenocysteine methylase